MMAGEHTANIGAQLNWCCQTDNCWCLYRAKFCREPLCSTKVELSSKKRYLFASSSLLHCTSTKKIVVLIQKCQNLIKYCGTTLWQLYR